MPSFRVSPPFTLTADDWRKIGTGALLAGLGGVGAYLSAKAIPTLQEHVANDYGALIVAIVATSLPIIGNILRKFLGETTTVAGAVLLCLMLAPAGASAEEIAVLLPDAAKSYIVTVDAQGVATVFPLKSMVRPGPAPIPPTPIPDALTDRAKEIKALAEKVTGDPDRAATAHGLAVLFREIGKLVRQGQVKDVPSLVSAVSMGTNTFLSSRGSGVAQLWQPVRDKFSTQWTVLTAGNKPLADYAVLLDDCAAGLDASGPQRSLDPEMLKLILQIIQLILSILRPTP